MTVPTPRIERVREIGRGATSRVDLARLEEAFGEWPAGHEIAVKSLLPERRGDAAARRALAEEARAAHEARHASLVRLLFAAEDGDGPFLALELVPGEDLRHLLAAGEPLAEARVRAIGSQLAGALAALHRAGRVHGDVKPENARLDASGRAVLVDLGFARRAAERSGTTPGSLAYLAPEAVSGAAPSPASDVFSLGIVLHELATGHHPFVASGPLDGVERPAPAGDPARHLARLERLAHEHFVPPSRQAPELSPFFDALVESLLEPEPGDRPTAAEVERRLAGGERGAWWKRVARRGTPSRPDPMVGREEELAVLGRALGELRPASGVDRGGAGRGAAVWLTGPAGSGKSRLVSEFVTDARRGARPPLFLYARASARRESRPVGTLLFLLRRWLGVPHGATLGATAVHRLQHTVSPRDAEVLAQALGPETAELPTALPSALSAWLTALARTRPAIVFVDDLHRAGEATLAALALFVREVPETEVLLVLGVREDEPAWQPDALERLHGRLAELASRRDALPFFEVALGPLDERAVRALVDRRFHPSAPRLRLARLLWERGFGNPGLVAELLRGLEESGSVAPAGGKDRRWRLLVAPDALPYPQSLERAIADRVERLDPTDRAWLSRMAVAGGRFDAESLTWTFGALGEEDLEDVLVRLAEADWLEPIGGQYRFERPALREAVWGRMPEDERAALHGRVADALGVAPHPSSDVAFERAYHLRQAGRQAELVELLLPLLDRLPESGQPQRALTLVQSAIEACGASGVAPARMLDLYETGIDAANRLGRRQEERDMLDRMIELPLDLERSPALAARVYLAHGRHALGTGDLGLARGWFANAAQLARNAGSDALACDALRRLAVVHGLTGDLAKALELAREALAIAPDARRRAFAWLVVAQADVLENRIESALDALASARHELAGLDEASIWGALGALDMLTARVFRSAGRQGRALAAAGRAVRRARRAGDRRLEVEASARLGGLLIDLDRLDDAEAHLRDATTLAREIEDRGGEALAGLWLSVLLWERDDERAADQVARTVATAGELGLFRLRALALALQARQFHAAGDLRRASDTSATAQDLLARYGAELVDGIVISGTRALVLHAAGRRGEARALVRRLRRTMRDENRAVARPELRGAQRRYTTRLLEAVLSPDGPLYPRSPVGD